MRGIESVRAEAKANESKRAQRKRQERQLTLMCVSVFAMAILVLSIALICNIVARHRPLATVSRAIHGLTADQKLYLGTYFGTPSKHCWDATRANTWKCNGDGPAITQWDADVYDYIEIVKVGYDVNNARYDRDRYTWCSKV